MVVGTRYTQHRLDQKMSKMLTEANRDIAAEYTAALAPIAADISGKIRGSGFGGDHNEEFAKQETKAWRAGSGRLNVLFGWLNPSDHAHERGSNGRLWYQYADAGFHLFGGPRWIDGVGATIDRRERVIEAIEEVNRRWISDIARAGS